MTAEKNEEPEAKHTFDTVWDEYDGQYVFLQLKFPYFAVTAPGVLAKVPGQEGRAEPLQLPVLNGLFRVKKDSRGDVRIRMLIDDPDQRKETKIRMDFSPDLIAYLSIAPLESVIIT